MDSIGRGLPWWLSGKESSCNAGGSGSIPGLGRSLEEGNGNPLQYSCLENPVDREAWQATVHGVEKELDTTEGGWQSEISVCDTSKHQGDCTRATLLVIWWNLHTFAQNTVNLPKIKIHKI